MTSPASAGIDEAKGCDNVAADVEEMSTSLEGGFTTVTASVGSREAVERGEASMTSVSAVHVLMMPQPNIMIKQA
jgi:hypothetical protein